MPFFNKLGLCHKMRSKQVKNVNKLTWYVEVKCHQHQAQKRQHETRSLEFLNNTAPT